MYANPDYLTMIIDLESLVEVSRPFEFFVDRNDLGQELDDIDFEKQIAVKGELIKEQDRAVVKGSITADEVINCTRCLEPVFRHLDFEFCAVYIAPEKFSAGKDVELSGIEMDADVLVGDSIDLTGVVREQILLELPTRFLCREDCRGLCQMCGANQNLINCCCKETETDPRWDALKNIK